MADRVDKRAWFWLAACVAVAAALLWVAISNDAYEITSPFWLTWHVLLRKSYSIVAFGLVGFLLAGTLRALRSRWGSLNVGLAVGANIALIELCQRMFAGARESLAQQALDVAIGFVGGALGALLLRRTAARGPRG